MRYRMRYETRGFDEYLNIYNEKNKLTYYSVEVDYSRPKRLLYSKAQERLTMIDFGTDDIDDLINGYPVYFKGKKVGYYAESLEMEETSNVEFARLTEIEWSFVEVSERLTFREYELFDKGGKLIMSIKRPGRDFICDIANDANEQMVIMALSLASIEFWKYITTTRDF